METTDHFPTQSWQFFEAARKQLGGPALQACFGNVSATQLYRWARNPELETDTQPGPLLNLSKLFGMLVAVGRSDLAEAGLRILCERCGAQASFVALRPLPTGESLPGAMAAVVEAVSELQRQLRSGADAKIVDSLADVVRVRVSQLAEGTRQAQATGSRPRWSRGTVPAPAEKAPWYKWLLGRG